MIAKLLDEGTILLENDQWRKLEEEWGNPVDLEIDADDCQSVSRQAFSTLDLRKTTFDSSFLFKKVRRKVGRQLSRTSSPDYKEFIQNLRHDTPKDTLTRQFYCINGAIISSYSVEEICKNIDEIFKSVEKLCSATSTIRRKKDKYTKIYPDIVQCSISMEDLSFDDTKESLEKNDYDVEAVDRYIDEVFERLDSTIQSLAEIPGNQEYTNTVTGLVKKFSSLLKSPAVNCSPRRKRVCSDRFKSLTEFWNNGAVLENTNSELKSLEI